ncbi:hypothetical protein SAMD00019534_024550 [Acytostelium subglobosum LB1]|uniref:hypothetical protein n=1 Tax=Acytostelium subglobosum LB1 TaxID=1410327 RepID=UPI00064500DD|nr:hypothetical protein SAMD00019534_024550 [Acytostelium subglobosum LB1]GAM19280.1 hypothetical protein SAMD00019534_024550 [Acytostelium subglobosum LB1]|eukprot:XP_012757207.1 hypothetical protein SAMD00019534_024550 [Acytostelium subglobosum LB1]
MNDLASLTTNTFNIDINVYKSMTCLSMKESFNSPITKDMLPSSLLALDLGGSFNQPIIPGVTLPDSITKLSFGPVDKYPSWSSTNMTMFNQPLLVGSLPSSLIDLSLSYLFNQEVLPGVLPKSLIKLRFGGVFSRVLTADSLPSDLRELVVSRSYSHPIPPLPSLRSLTISSDNQLDTTSLPLIDTLILFEAGPPLPLPQSLTHLVMPYFGASLNYPPLPESLTKWELPQTDGTFPSVIPPSLTRPCPSRGQDILALARYPNLSPS